MGCAFGALLVTFIMRNFIKVADPNNPGKAVPIVLGWTGMRGVVSLAAALSIPLTIGTTTTPFPHAQFDFVYHLHCYSLDIGDTRAYTSCTF